MSAGPEVLSRIAEFRRRHEGGTKTATCEGCQMLAIIDDLCARLEASPGDPRLPEGEWMQRLAEWDENRVWLDGAWWEIDSYGREDATGFCVDVTMHRMNPQPSPIVPARPRSEPGPDERTQ